jgi:hypothetical protein
MGTLGSSPYHAGELAVQDRLGVRVAAERVGRSYRSDIPPAAKEFLRAQPWVLLGATDARERVWLSPLCGPPGFIEPVDDGSILLHEAQALDDPLAIALRPGSEVGVWTSNSPRGGACASMGSSKRRDR